MATKRRKVDADPYRTLMRVLGRVDRHLDQAQGEIASGLALLENPHARAWLDELYDAIEGARRRLRAPVRVPRS